VHAVTVITEEIPHLDKTNNSPNKNRVSKNSSHQHRKNNLRNYNQNARHCVPSTIHLQITDIHLRKSIETPT